MALPRWCLHLEIQNTTDNVGYAPLPKTKGIVGVILRGGLPARVAKIHLQYYARDQASDLSGFDRLDAANTHAPVEKTECANVPDPGIWVETNPISFLTDDGQVSGIKSKDNVTARLKARWAKYDTSLNPLHAQMRVELGLRRDNTPNPPDIVILASTTINITTSLVLYTPTLFLDWSWSSNHRYLLRCVGRFQRAGIQP